MNTDTKESEGGWDRDQGSEPVQADVFRVSISRKAEEALSKVIEQVNSGFEGGKVLRHQLVNWLICRFADRHTDDDIKELRADHFDEVALLEVIYRRAKKAGTLSPELRLLLLKESGLDDRTSQRGKSKSTRV